MIRFGNANCLVFQQAFPFYAGSALTFVFIDECPDSSTWFVPMNMNTIWSDIVAALTTTACNAFADGHAGHRWLTRSPGTALSGTCPFCDKRPDYRWLPDRCSQK